MGYSADAEVHRPVSEDAQDQSFSQRQGLGAGQPGRPGGHRKTLSLPASNFDWQQPHHGRPPDLLSRGSHPIGRRSHSLQQMRERLSIAIHRGSVVRLFFARHTAVGESHSRALTTQQESTGDLVCLAAIAAGCIWYQAACLSGMGRLQCWLHIALHVCRIPGTGWIRALERMWAARRPGASGIVCPVSYEASPAGSVQGQPGRSSVSMDMKVSISRRGGIIPDVRLVPQARPKCHQ